MNYLIFLILKKLTEMTKIVNIWYQIDEIENSVTRFLV